MQFPRTIRTQIENGGEDICSSTPRVNLSILVLFVSVACRCRDAIQQERSIISGLLG